MPLLSDADIGLTEQPKRLLSDSDIGLDYGNMSWSEVFSRAAPRIAEQFNEANERANREYLGPSIVKDVAIGTGKTILGAAEHALGFTPQQQISDEQEVASALLDRVKKYTSIGGVKELIATDPGGVAADVVSIALPTKSLRGTPTAAVPKIATSAELKAGGGAGLNVAKESGVYFTDEFINPLADTLVQTARQGGFRPGRTGTSDLTNIMKDVESMRSRPWSFRDLHELGQDLNDAAGKAANTGNRTNLAIANRMRVAVNRFLDSVEKAPKNKRGQVEGVYATNDLAAADAVNIFQQSKQIYAAGKRAELAERMLRKAETDRSQFVQSGFANSIKKYARQTVKKDIDGKRTGFSREDMTTLNELANNRISDWVLQKARSYAGPVGTLVGAQLGGPVGALVAYGLGEGVKATADRIALNRFTKFMEAIRVEGSQKLQALVGDVAIKHLDNTPKGRAAVTNWVKSIGTNRAGAATKSLALIVSQIANRPDLAPRIEQEVGAILKELESSDEQPFSEH